MRSQVTVALPVEVSRPRITVVTHQRWRVEELSQFADVHHDLGLDTSAAADDHTFLWCPGAWAAAAVQRYPHMQLSSPGPDWLDTLPASLTGRAASTFEASDLRPVLRVSGLQRVFAKLPETKHERFEAGVRAVDDLDRELAQLPLGELVQVQPPVQFGYEVRCWVLSRTVVAATPYFVGVAREQWSEHSDPAATTAAVQWLTTALQSRSAAVPPAAVIDVGWCSRPFNGDPGWRVVEANAPWSADWYDAEDMTAVLRTVRASQRGVSDRWRWRPSPLLVNSSLGLARR